MRHTAPAKMEICRVLLVRRDASELLVFETQAGLHLVTAEIPVHSRVAEELNAWFKIHWNLDVYSLYCLPAPDTCPAARYLVVETLDRDAAAPQTARWISTRVVNDVQFHESLDSIAVQTWLERPSTESANGSPGPFTKPGWLFAVRELVEEAIRPISLKLTGSFLQLNASPSFNLIRFETDGAAVWFKAVSEPNTREFPLTLALCAKLSAYMPRLLATQPLWNAWMTLEVPGVPLVQCEHPSAWTRAARDLAKMQVASIGMAEEILRCGARDVRTETLLGQLKPFFATMGELMKQQPRNPPSPLSPIELTQLEAETGDVLLATERTGIPDTVGHLDLNSGNIIVQPDRTVFLDWAEGCVGHPFFSFAYLLEYFMRAFGGSSHAESALVRAYADVWAPVRSVRNFDETLADSVFLAVFAHAVSTDLWRDETKLSAPSVAGYYRSLVRRLKRYRDRIRRGVSSVSEVFA
ncbi:MAG TPA: phosphotransferase [Candidatus Saccharimonadales bacterium]|nr:phosphotransferase [Candidatus Saccharimonadales bacterium]